MTAYTFTKDLLVVPPAVEPVSLAMALKHLRRDDHSDDDLIAAWITAARQTIEQWCWSSFITQTWQYWWDRFHWQMYLPRGPLISKVGDADQWLKYIPPGAANNVYVTVPTSIYELSEHRKIPLYRIQYLQTWPITRGYRDDVCTQIVTGYGPDGGYVPGPIKQAILLLLTHMDLNRGEVPAEMPTAIDHLIANYRFKEL
jgi:uncharacterized phiE125 gp8 family phage protein